jgi:hypothetical protein
MADISGGGVAGWLNSKVPTALYRVVMALLGGAIALNLWFARREIDRFDDAVGRISGTQEHVAETLGQVQMTVQAVVGEQRALAGEIRDLKEDNAAQERRIERLQDRLDDR